MNILKSNACVLPLLIGAFLLQTLVSFFMPQFRYVLLADDLGDSFAAAALFFAIPYRFPNLKSFALAFACWSLFSFLHNIKWEINFINVNIWEYVIIALCLTLFAFGAASVFEIARFERKTQIKNATIKE